MITLLRRGGRVTQALLALRGSSSDHHENHLRPQYNLSVFCHQHVSDMMPDLKCLHTSDSNDTRRAYCARSQYLATMVKIEIWKRVSCRVWCRYSASPITNTAADLQMPGDLLSFSRYFARTKISAWATNTRHCRTINKSAANGRVLLILLPLVRATNDLFLFSSHITALQESNIWQRLKCSKLGIETGARSDKFFHRLIPF